MDVGSASQSPTGMVTPPASNKESGGLGDGTAQARPRSGRDRTGQDNEGSAALVGWAPSRTLLAGWPQAGWPGWSRWLRLECRATNGRCFGEARHDVYSSCIVGAATAAAAAAITTAAARDASGGQLGRGGQRRRGEIAAVVVMMVVEVSRQPRQLA